MEFIPSLILQKKLLKPQTIHPIHPIIIKIILEKNHFKSKRIILFLPMLIPMKERMKTTQKVQIITPVGAKTTVVK